MGSFLPDYVCFTLEGNKMASANKCLCRQSTRELTKLVSEIAGFPVTGQTVLRWRRALAQEYCDQRWATDTDAACIGNPYLPNEMIGSAYIYSERRLRQVAIAIAARLSKEKTLGRRRYKKLKEEMANA